MESNKSLSGAGYFLAILLFTIPLFDAVTSVWPPHLGDERWRFGAIGALSNIMLIPLAGLLVAVTIATFSDHRRTRRIIGWLCIVLAIVDAVLVVLFILDYFQTRTVVRPQFQHAMSVATTVALLKHAYSLIALLLLGRAGFAGPRVMARKVGPVTEPRTQTPLIPLSEPARSE